MNYILVHHPDCIGVVTADADGQHALEDIPRFLAEGAAHAGAADDERNADRIADAVAASASFPPFVSPFTLRLDPDSVVAVPGADLHDRRVGAAAGRGCATAGA